MGKALGGVLTLTLVGSFAAQLAAHGITSLLLGPFQYPLTV
jgi:hypothetical protein